VQIPSGMSSPLAKYLANDSVNNRQQYTATNGNALQPSELQINRLLKK
jgi:hypothetical protein